MDLLRKELERKKKALKEAKEAAGDRPFIKAGELRRLQEEREEAERNKRRKRDEEESSSMEPRKQPRTTIDEKAKAGGGSDGDGPIVESGPGGQHQELTGTTSEKVPPNELSKLSSDQITQKLRLMGLPVRLFGECRSNTALDERRERLQKALADHSAGLATLSEKEEFRLEKGHSIRNPFLEKDEEEATTTTAAAAAVPREDKTAPDASDSKETKEEDLSKDPHKKIYKYFKGLLKDWEEDLSKRSEQVKRSVAGRNETKTMKQCKDYIKPLFKLCKSRKLEEGLSANLVKIVDFCREGEFVKAHDVYMDVAIGRAAWPIGVTMVGIHARTGRSKIESQNVAHVMNSELQRKYLTSIKRLMTYSQSRRTDIDPSKKVVN